MFQFTRPRGARRLLASKSAPRSEFQFTRPRGARHLDGFCREAINRFNSRAHEGRDSACRAIPVARVFQFTRPRGARQGQRLRPRGAVSFNSRAHEGRDSRG